MNEDGFRDWLRTNYKPNTVSTKLSECRNLAVAYGDLDQLYDTDRLDGVMRELAYSAEDRAASRPNPSKLSISSDLYRDLSNYRTAVNYYRNFREGTSRRSGVRRPDIQAVNKAMDEYDALGFDAFMQAYNFGSSISYWVLRDGKRYPSKAIFGVAHQFMPNGGPLDNEGCSGTDARKHLANLGFEIQTDEGQSPPQDRSRRYWIEKTRADRDEDEHKIGKALWSPQRSKSGGDIYANMRAVQPGDVIFHLTENEAITGVSAVAEGFDDTLRGLPGTGWEGDAYRVALHNYEALVPPLERSAFLETEPFAAELSELAKSGAKGLFYNAHRGLNQGAYLTEATPTLLSILNRAYQAFAGQSLPHLDEDVITSSAPAATGNSYTLDDALEELFLDRAEAEQIMLLWRAKKNIILQGPPGVGKSFAAQRLAFALIGATDRDRLGFVQFHQSYSYEDFVEGYRPTADGFELRPGKFVEFCRRAEADPQQNYVFVIDEINRGNLSKILGELMLLVEADKRSPDWAMALASGKVPFHVPGNVYLLGLMNTADRSLAVVDYALRRRFAFVDLVPKLSSQKFRGQLNQAGVSDDVIGALIMRVGALNEEIVSDTANLGRGFEIGHSFFCSGPSGDEDGWAWYQRVIRTEVLHLLREYWFDAPAKITKWEAELLAPL